MQCPRCHHENPGDAKFCLECGRRLALSCGGCGIELPAGAKFCKECGQAVGAATSPTAARVGAPPESYTPKHLAEKILTSKTALEGERKLVTVLFCDIANSTALAERVGPDAMHALLSHFFELALAEVHRYEGTINQFLGDGFMALFGAPVAHEDHARRAALAAVAIRETLGGRVDLGLSDSPELTVRMGLNTGAVVVGAIGDNLRMDYTAIGDTTNLAARLQQYAEPGQILISEATTRLVKGYVRFQALAPFHAKGKAEPIIAFRVVGLGTRRSRVDTEAYRTLSQFVGRDRELAILRDVLAEVQAGSGQVVGIVGEPGVGKSRLLYEFRRSVEAAPVTYLEGRCLSYGSATPYLPLQDIIRDNCGINSTDTPGQIGEKIRAALEQVGMNPEEARPYLLQVLGVKEGTEQLAQIEPRTIKARISDILRQMSMNGSRRRTLILAVEDLHWIDKTSEEYFSSAIEWLAGVPILLLMTYRPGYKPPWIDKSYATQMALRPLSSTDSLRVVESVVERTTPISDSTTEVIISKAEGNPFFLEELTRVALDRDRQGASVTIPDTIQGVLAARIDRLPAEPKRVLQTAAVLGREFSLRLLKAISQDARDLERDLGDLKRLEFVYERTGVDDVVYAFKHALTQEVAYDTLLVAHRQALHWATGEALEEIYMDRLEEHYEQLAHHYRSARSERALQKAATYSRHAGHKAAARSADRAAIGWFERALEALRQLPETAEILEEAIDIRLALRIPFMALGQYPPGVEHLLEAEHQARTLRDDRRLGRVSASIGNLIWTAGRAIEAHRCASTAVRIGESLGDLPILVVGNHTLGLSNHILGAYRDAGHAFRKAVNALAERPDLVEAELRGYPGWCRTFWGVSLAEQGKFSEALAVAHEGLKIVEAIDYNLGIRICSQQVGWVYLLTKRRHRTSTASFRTRSCAAARVRLRLRDSACHAHAGQGPPAGRPPDPRPLVSRTRREAHRSGGRGTQRFALDS